MTNQPTLCRKKPIRTETGQMQPLRRIRTLQVLRKKNSPAEIQETAANAFKRDLPNAEIHFVPSGHFALESHHTKIAQLMREFLVGGVQ